jgi:putative resolvase
LYVKIIHGGDKVENHLTAMQINNFYNISAQTLRRWESNGDLHPLKTTGGHRRYKESELLAVLGIGDRAPRGGRCALYGRVSTQKQADSGNLDRQMDRLKDIAKRRGYAIVAEYKEIASGMNENRKQLAQLMDSIADGKIDIVLVEYRDRLARFGYKYLTRYCQQFGAIVDEADDRPAKEPQEELVDDMIAIVTSFSTRLYGERGGRVVKKLTKAIESEATVDEDNSTRSNPGPDA